MKKSNFYKFATWLLLLLNLSLISFFFLTKPRPPHLEGNANFSKRATDIFEFSQQQDEAFLQLVDGHKQQMKSVHQAHQDVLKSYFNTLSDTSQLNQVALYLDNIEKLERKKATITYQHFEDVRSILTNEQEEHFDEFVKHALNKIIPVPPRTPPNH